MSAGEEFKIYSTGSTSLDPKDYLLPGETDMRFFFAAPKYSEWECELYGMGRAHVWRPLESQKIPNWFWRKMQFLVLGNRWVKRKS